MARKQALVFATLALFGLSECFYSRQQIPCSGKTEESAGDSCSFCINTTYARRLFKTRPLLRYMRSLHSLVNMGDCGNFTWNASAIRKGIDLKQTAVTFFAWSIDSPSCSGDDSSKCMGHPIKGCCGIPLDRGGCQATVCLEGQVYVGLSSGTSRDAHMHPVRERPMRTTDCANVTVARTEEDRFVYLCPEVVPEWLKKADAECLRYNMNTGVFDVSKKRPKFESISRSEYIEVRRAEMARKVTKMCTFPLSKDRVFQEPAVKTSWNDEVLFNREVRKMASLSWDGHDVVDTRLNSTIQCSVKSVTNYSEVTSPQPVQGKDVYFCAIFWTKGNAPEAKCMPQNASVSTVYKAKPTFESDTFVTIVVVSCLGGMILLCLAVLLCLTARRKFVKYVKTKDEVPEHLNRIMQEDVGDFGKGENAYVGESEVFEALAPDNRKRLSVEI